MNRPVLLVALLCALLAVLLRVRPSFAQPIGGAGPTMRHFPHAPSTPPPSPAGPGKIRLTLDDGDRGPLVLVPRSGGFVGEFVVWNDGQGPLTISRVTTRGDEDDPRLPPHVRARFADGGGGSSVIQPHSSKRISVTWTPDREPKLHEAVGHIVLTSNDEAAGEVAMGFIAPYSGPYGFVTAHLLSWLLLLPIFGAVAAFAMRAAGAAKDESLRRLTLSLTAVQCLLAIVLYEGFNGAVTRPDGNDGFQFVERGVLVHSLGVEYFVGVDGASVSLVLLTAVVGFVGAVASYGVSSDATQGKLPIYHGMYLLLLGAAMGVFVSLDLSVLFAFWVTMLVALHSLVAIGRGASRGAVMRKLALYGGVSSALLLFAVGALHLHSDPTFLADGTRVEHTFAIPELMRVAYNAKHLELLGCSWVKVVWGALFLGFAVLVPIIPLHRWFVDLIDEVPAPVAAVVAGVVLKTGLYGMLRVSLGILPDGSRWAATTLVAFGVITIALGAISALWQGRLQRFVTYAAIGQIGFCLVGMGAMTREGEAGCLVQMWSHGIIVPMLILLVAAIQDRAKTDEIAKLGGRMAGMPLCAVVAGVGILGLAGIPGLSGFWGELVCLLGAFPVQRVLVVAAVVGGAVVVVHSCRVLQRVFSGAAAPAERLPDLGVRDLAALAPLFVLSVALGLFPAPFFKLVQGGVSDLNQLVNPPGPDEVAVADFPAPP